ncbi:hypothetical protein T440DRAFT_475817 [Plenodomus tracheiphilus IPT5]|uniref:Uncharacterized protein n=1 Tax=Plenodomus tracheiphilus IPT5 TaxID=1408161 RepID=A0A6A7BKR3_9PLEO|nr:hypothetical protein T440DRAFT_475817 [Plenodomus tracheiphilus IPT5]
MAHLVPPVPDQRVIDQPIDYLFSTSRPATNDHKWKIAVEKLRSDQEYIITMPKARYDTLQRIYDDLNRLARKKDEEILELKARITELHKIRTVLPVHIKNIAKYLKSRYEYMRSHAASNNA